MTDPDSRTPDPGPGRPSNMPTPAPAYGPHVVVGYRPGPPRGLSITSMVLGLVSMVAGFTFLVPVVGLILGIVGLRKEPAGRGMAITGLVLNGLFVIGWALLIILVFAVGIGTAPSQP